MGLNKDVYLGQGNNLSIQTSQNVELNEQLILTTEDGSIGLDVKITADFGNIPIEYHEVFLNMMSAKYYNKVSFGDNPFSKCLPIKKKKWYEFWK